MVAADIVWMLVSTALVLLMTPALAFFYAGLVRSKNALNTLMMSLCSLGFAGMAWALLGYSLAFAPGNGLVGGFAHVGLMGVDLAAKGTIPHLLFMAYQATFAVITAALISGAIVERMRFGPYLAFITLWTLVVYAPMAHQVWGGGWLGTFGTLDYAGGTVVHVNAGAAAVVAAWWLGPRRDHGRKAMLPHHVPSTVLGAGLLWFGWFGFNAGSALAANNAAALAFVNTLLAPMATLVVWTLIEVARTKRATAVGAATAIVVGLVAVTPAAGLVPPLAAIAIGALAALPSHFALVWRARSSFDDSLDVAAAHGLGGTVGALLTGVFASVAWGAPVNGSVGQVGIQLVSILYAVVWSSVLSVALLAIIGRFTQLRATSRDEAVGLDVSQHGEEAYTTGEGAILVIEGKS